MVVMTMMMMIMAVVVHDDEGDGDAKTMMMKSNYLESKNQLCAQIGTREIQLVYSIHWYAEQEECILGDVPISTDVDVIDVNIDGVGRVTLVLYHRGKK